MSENPKVLIVEDSQALAILYREYLRLEPIQTTLVTTGGEAIAFIEKNPPHAIALDLELPDMNGMEILKYVVREKLPTAVVVVTGLGSVHVAVEAMRAGAFDFIEKPFTPERLTITLRNAVERQRMSELLDTYEDESRERFHHFLGASPVMRGVYHIIESAAPSKATVFITGESGTGKELCAEAIHQESDRSEKPFIAINCAAIPKDLIESEIFGHVKGAFTGAYTSRQGAAARADTGTLFLDEICEMDLDLQTKLLRFIQSGAFQPVGGSALQKVDIRFVCATNRDPLKEVEEGRFREDLYYRLHVIPIVLPPLRKRGDDVLLIARSFLDEYSQEEDKHFVGLDEKTEAIFLDYAWPGNVRQLQNVMRNIVVLNDGELVTPDMLPPPLDQHAVEALQSASRTVAVSSHTHNGNQQPYSLPMGDQEHPIRPLADVEKEVIERAINLCEGNIPKAAIHLGISASTIYRKKQTWSNQAT